MILFIVPLIKLYNVVPLKKYFTKAIPYGNYLYLTLSLSISLSLFLSVLFALIKWTPSSLCGLWNGNYSIYKYPDWTTFEFELPDCLRQPLPSSIYTLCIPSLSLLHLWLHRIFWGSVIVHLRSREHCYEAIIQCNTCLISHAIILDFLWTQLKQISVLTFSSNKKKLVFTVWLNIKDWGIKETFLSSVKWMLGEETTASTTCRLLHHKRQIHQLNCSLPLSAHHAPL